ncbi:MAG: hypothetical protein ABEI58_00010 [Candidatus Nanohaloarchaea archaeon]
MSAEDATVERALKLVKSKWRSFAERYSKFALKQEEGITEWAEEEEQTVEFVVRRVIREAETGDHEAAVQKLDEMLEKLRSGETYYKERIDYREYRGHEDVDLEVEVVVESIYEALLEEYVLEIERRDQELVELGQDFIEMQSSYWKGYNTEMAMKNAATKPFIAANETARDLREEAAEYERIKNSLRFIEHLESHEEDRYNLNVPEEELRAAEQAADICEEREQELSEIVEQLGEAREVGSIARQMVSRAGNPGVLRKLDEAFMTGRSLKQVSNKYDRKVRVRQEFIEDVLESLEQQGVEVQDVRDAIEEEGVQNVGVINLLASKKLEIAEQDFAELQDRIQEEEKDFIQKIETSLESKQ